MDRMIVALDGMTKRRALTIAKTLKGSVWGFKVNDLLYDDPGLMRELRKFGRVFADAKLHDIPNTVFNSTRKLASRGADIITVHAAGGIEMMKAAKKAAGKSDIFAVTVLTSQGEKNTEANVVKLAKDALRAGVGGIVCSTHELRAVKKHKPLGKLLLAVPGIRPLWHTKRDDQMRTASPEEALALGADFLIIGRPITQAKDPYAALQQIFSPNSVKASS